MKDNWNERFNEIMKEKDSWYYNFMSDEFINGTQSDCFAILMNRGYGIVITNDKLFAWNGMTQRRAELIALERFNIK